MMLLRSLFGVVRWIFLSVASALNFHSFAIAELPVMSKGMVSSGHPLATQAGINALKSGGNAVDAAVAVGLSLGVVDGHNSGIGGGCFMMIRLADGEFVLIDGREKAPATAHRDMFIRDGNAMTELSQTGSLASAVPGEIAAFDFALKHYGKKKFAELLLPAAKLAEEGFPLNPVYALRLKAAGTMLEKFESSREVFFPSGKLVQKGEVLRQPALAKTYRAIAEHGSDWFYRGPFAAMTDAWMKAEGGMLTRRDFDDYKIELRKPIRSKYRGYDLVSFPPPSSGGVHVAQMLQILEHFELKSFDEGRRYHVVAEAMKLAFADRAFWLGDPAFAKVPRNLVSPEYAMELARKIDPARATPVRSHGTPADAAEKLFDDESADDRHTTHFSVVDDQGNWVSCTATINTGFGSKVIIPGTGVLLNNQMDDFSIQPGVANYFGLIGAEANAIASGKRPLSSMSPTIVLKNGEPIIAIGAAGGPRIISCVLQELVFMLELGMSPQEAISKPRLHHQWFPDELMYEKTVPAEIIASLQSRGHVMRELSSSSNSHIVAKNFKGPGFVGAADPRGDGSVQGW
jgi:gamma-glutamyltranspeptidase/glutathione hydrolase